MAIEWDVSGVFNRFISSVSGNGAFSSNRWLTGPDGGIIVGIQDSSAATTENNYYETTNKTEVSVDQDNQFNVNINDVGNTTNTSVLDFEKLEYWDIENLTYSPIDNLVYNAGDKSYTVNNIYNISFTYNYTYYIQIGASEEYVGAYEVYFELPDGRNSKDLTADEIYGLSTDAGFINFDVANENPDLLGLWPMDGNLSRLNCCRCLTMYPLSWAMNASSTYLETDNFGGALYIPYVNDLSLAPLASS